MHRTYRTITQFVGFLVMATGACGVQTHTDDDAAEAGALAAYVEPACGNGVLDPGEQCEVGAAGPGSPKRWTAAECTSDCQATIYVSRLTPIAGECGAPRSGAFFACTLSCTADDDCPALPLPYKRPRCNLIDTHTCDQPCDETSDCLPDSKLTCFKLREHGSVCTNAF